MRGDLLALLDRLVGGLHDRRAGQHRRARDAGAAAGDELIAVALHELDAVERHAELLGEDLREGRGVALAVVERAGDDGDSAVVVEADAAHFGGAGGGGLDVAADAETAQSAGFLALALALLESGDIGLFHRVIEQAGEVAGIVDQAGRRRERNILGADEIAASQFEAVDAEFGRRIIHHAFHVVGAFGAPGAAIGRDERRVGEHALGRHFEQRRAVHADIVLGDVERRQQRAEGGEIAAHVAEAGQADSLDDAALVEGGFHRHVEVAAVMVGDEAAGALVGPFHRPAEHLRGMQDADIFRIGGGLHAERAADIAGEDAELLGLGAEDVAHHVLEAEYALAARMQGPLPVRLVIFADR